MLAKLSLSAAVAAAIIAAGPGVVSSSAATAPVSNARVAEHFNLAAGQTPENIAIARDGTKYVTFAEGRQVAAISPSGAVTVLATMPLPADGA